MCRRGGRFVRPRLCTVPSAVAAQSPDEVGSILGGGTTTAERGGVAAAETEAAAVVTGGKAAQGTGVEAADVTAGPLTIGSCFISILMAAMPRDRKSVV